MRMRALRARPSVRIRPYGFVGRLQALDGDAFGLAGMDDALLVRGDALRGFGDPRGDLVGDRDDPVLVAVQQVTGLDPHASHLGIGHHDSPSCSTGSVRNLV